MKLPFAFILVGSVFLTPFASAVDGPKTNMLQNGDFSVGEGQRVYRWLVPPTPLKGHGEDAAQIGYGIVMDGAGNPGLGLSTAKPMKAHIWWQQEVTALPATTYQFTVRMSGEILNDGGTRSYLVPDVLIYFLSATGSWIGYEPLPKTVEFSKDWQTVTIKITTPEDAVKMGVRLGMSTSSQVKVRFDDATLVQLK
ncbi:MAG: hypothetical protein WC205_01680 [Opitutaceae bacterium]|jgi:hypothetical protein